MDLTDAMCEIELLMRWFEGEELQSLTLKGKQYLVISTAELLSSATCDGEEVVYEFFINGKPISKDDMTLLRIKDIPELNILKTIRKLYPRYRGYEGGSVLVASGRQEDQDDLGLMKYEVAILIAEELNLDPIEVADWIIAEIGDKFPMVRDEVGLLTPLEKVSP